MLSQPIHVGGLELLPLAGFHSQGRDEQGDSRHQAIQPFSVNPLILPIRLIWMLTTENTSAARITRPR